MCWIADRFISFAAIVVTVARPLAAGISLTFAIGLVRSLDEAAEGGMDCTREVLMIGNCASIMPERL